MKLLAFVAALLLPPVACLGDSLSEQLLIGRWKTRENITVIFTKEHTLTMKNPDLPIGAAGRWTLHPEGRLEVNITAQLASTMREKPVPQQTVIQMLTLSGKDVIDVKGLDGLSDRWVRLP
jgi:hypothetical protein